MQSEIIAEKDTLTLLDFPFVVKIVGNLPSLLPDIPERAFLDELPTISVPRS
jgi:hypothetical protein